MMLRMDLVCDVIQECNERPLDRRNLILAQILKDGRVWRYVRIPSLETT